MPEVDVAVQNFFAQTIATAHPRIMANKEINKYTGRDFSSINLCVSMHETFMSSIIANLLDPMGNHGQGSKFLELFTSMVLNDDTLDCSNVTVGTEVFTTNIKNKTRKIDILLTGSNWVCAIENKPRAKEQPKQLEDYAKNINNEDINKNGKPNCFLVFLSDITPESLSSDGYKETLRIWLFNKPHWEKTEPQSYNQYPPTFFFDWLGACKQNCEAAKVRYFIEDFENAISTYLW